MCVAKHCQRSRAGRREIRKLLSKSMGYVKRRDVSELGRTSIELLTPMQPLRLRRELRP